MFSGTLFLVYHCLHFLYILEIIPFEDISQISYSLQNFTFSIVCSPEKINQFFFSIPLNLKKRITCNIVIHK